MKFIAAFNALNVIAKSPAIREWLGLADPNALRQVEEAIAPVRGDSDVEVNTRLLVERLENIIANLRYRSAAVTAEMCNGRGHVTVNFALGTPAHEVETFRTFCATFLHPNAMVVERGDVLKARSIQFILDEDNI